MHETFEELVSKRLDALYHGALFLCGGGEGCASELLVDAVVSARRTYRRAGGGGGADPLDPSRWLEGELAREFIGRHGRERGPEPIGSGDVPPTSGTAWLERLTPEDLFGAASRVPARARAALWLVLLRRWGYEDAARLIGTDRDGLRDLLGARATLLAALMRSGGRGEGLGGGRA